jgi:hypothetical protein
VPSRFFEDPRIFPGLVRNQRAVPGGAAQPLAATKIDNACAKPSNGVFNPAMSDPKHPFDSWLSVGVEYLDGILENPPSLPWTEFWLNPRRLRGSDFLMRWSQGVWSERRLVEAVNQTKEFFAVPDGQRAGI